MKSISAKRYAQAVFEIASEENQLTEWQNNLRKITEIMENKEIKPLLENPKLPLELKRKILEKCLVGTLPSVINLACLLISKGRTQSAYLIEQEYQNFLDTYKGIERAKVTTALILNDEDKEKITHKLEMLTNHKVIADFQLNSDIVGGVIIKIGDKLIDGSIKNKLANLKKSLTLV